MGRIDKGQGANVMSAFVNKVMIPVLIKEDTKVQNMIVEYF
jgi:hypothetical protein